VYVTLSAVEALLDGLGEGDCLAGEAGDAGCGLDGGSACAAGWSLGR
jgi:hypothetical protein